MRRFAGLALAPSLSLTRSPPFALFTGKGNWLAGKRPYGLLVLLCVILYTPGLTSIPPVDRDEARFAQATRQMLETGDFIRIRFQDEARNKKPIGIYWLQAAAVAAFSTPESTAIWPYRLPSVLAATAAVLLTFAWGAALHRSRLAGWLAAVLMASALGLVVEAHLAKTDAALLAAVVAAHGALGLAYVAFHSDRPVSRYLPPVFWLAEAAGILLKGPLALALALMTAAALSIADRDARWIRGLRPLTGLVATALITTCWLIPVEAASTGRFLADSVVHDLLQKLVGAQESHGAPPGYYLALAVASFWPGSLFIVPALIWGWGQRRSPAERFLLAWLIPAWVVFEFVPTKLPHYVLPLYPAAALLAGSALTKGALMGLAGGARLLDIVVRSLWGMVTIALSGALVLLPICLGRGASTCAIVAALMLLALAVLLLLYRRRPALAAGLSGALAAGFVLPAAFAVGPDLDTLWLSRSAAALLARHSPAPGQAVLAVGYSEPSLVFLLGTATRLVTATPGDHQLAGAGMALVSEGDDAEFRKALSARGLSFQAIGSVAGLDYSAGGGRLVLTLYDLRPG